MTRSLYILSLILTSVLLMPGLYASGEESSQGTICEGTYALCTSAPCIPDPDNPESEAVCECEVTSGKNFGMSECGARSLSKTSDGVTKLQSQYSFSQSPTKPVLVCPAGKPWTFCLDKPCVADPQNPLRAICECEIMRKDEFVTFGGSCNTLTCGKAFWSGATVSDFESASEMLMKDFGLADNPAQYCPGQAPQR